MGLNNITLYFFIPSYVFFNNGSGVTGCEFYSISFIFDNSPLPATNFDIIDNWQFFFAKLYVHVSHDFVYIYIITDLFFVRNTSSLK